MEYYNMKDTLSNADYNALVYLLRKFKKLTSDLKLGESVIESNYGTFNFSDGFVNVGNNWILDDDVTVTSNDVLKNTFYTFNFTVIDVNTSGVVNRRIVSVTGGTGENGELSLEIPVDLINADEVILPDYVVEVVFYEHEYYTPLPDVNVELSSTKEYIGKDESTVITVKLSRKDGTQLSNMLFNMTINEVPSIKKTDEHGECQIQYTGTGNTGKVIFNVLNESLTIYDYESIILTMNGGVVLGKFAYDIYLASEYPLLIDWGDGTSTKIHNPIDVMYHNYSDGETEHTVRILGEVSYIGAHAFDGNDACTKVWMNDSIHSILNDAFIRNYSLTSVKLPSKLTYLGGDCFRYCGNLLEIELPETISKINAYAFYNCTNLRKYILNWTQNIYRYNSNELPVNQDTIFSIPYGTTQDYVDARYPVSRLVEREPPVFSLILSCDEPITMKDNVSTVTALLKNNGEGIAGEVLNYVVKHGDNVLDNGSIVTGSDGTASISYTGTGVGDIEVIVSYGTLLQETFVIEDCFKYDTTVHTRTTTSSSDLLTPIYNDYSFVSDNFCAEFVWQGNGEGVGVGIAPKGRTTPYHHLLTACGTSRLSTYIGNEISGETSERWGSFQHNTDYRFKIEYMNGTVKFYINDELKITYSDKTYLNGETRDLYFLEWNRNLNIQVKEIKIKAL